MRHPGRRIVIVDPDVEAAEEFRDMFTSRSYEVEVCTGLTDAIRAIRNAKFDCVVMDMKLPEIMGHEAVPIIRAIEPSLAVILTTASNTKEMESKARSQDIHYYYIKSFDRKELEQAVDSLFQAGAKLRRGPS